MADRLTKLRRPVRIASRTGAPAFDWHDDSTWAASLEGVRAVYLAYYPDLAVPEAAAHIREDWEVQLPDVPLVIVESPYRALVGPLLAYLDVLDETWPADQEEPITFVVIPEFVARHWWERILYNQSANRLRRALLGRKHTVVVNVPYRRESEPDVAAEGAPA